MSDAAPNLKGISEEKFRQEMDKHPVDEIRRMLAQGHGIVLPKKVADKAALITAAWRKLTQVKEPEAPKSAPASEKHFEIRIKGWMAQRIRAGHRWTQHRQTVAERDFSAEQWAELRADQCLEIREV